MTVYPKKQNDFKTLRASIDKAIYLNKEELFCSNTYQLLIFTNENWGRSATLKDNRANIRTAIRPTF